MENCQQFVSHILHMCGDKTAHIIYQVIFITMIFSHQMYLCIACINNKFWEIMYDIIVTFHIHFIITTMSRHRIIASRRLHTCLLQVYYYFAFHVRILLVRLCHYVLLSHDLQIDSDVGLSKNYEQTLLHFDSNNHDRSTLYHFTIYRC